MRVHWAFRQLAGRLAQGGAHVLKFDYYGTGDSAGAIGSGDADRWRDDVVTALEELRDVSGVSRLRIVGARLGGALAASLPGALARSSKTLPIERLVLWDPVCSGRDYLRELQALEDRRIRNSRYPLERLKNPNCPELLGYPLSNSLRRSLESLDLGRAALTTAASTVIVASEPRQELAALLRRFGGAGSAERVDVAEDCRWQTQELLEEALLPTKVVEALAHHALKDSAA